MKKSVLITGANGQLGECIKELSSKFEELNFIFKSSKELDITSFNSAKAIFEKHQFNYCINCAAYTAVDLAEDEKEKAFAVNAEGVKHLAILSKDYNTSLIHISTDFVFDGLKNTPYTETDAPNPINVYGASKLQGEQYIKELLDTYFIFRTSWLYSEYGNNFMKTMLRLSKQRQELNVVNDQIGSPTYAKDLAEVILKVIKEDSTNYGMYHFSNKGETSWFGFAQEIFKQKKIQINLQPITSENYKTKAKRPMFSVLNNSKNVKELGVIQKSWKKSLSNCLRLSNS
ncbi:dTDP-4-dehydrorhamnose reductase [Meridianimaribacter sp. CL38]|uniref:dTDP-4-dehydrorhamnose reductase n=1 Tax=Meridianimaribacter sp. CL38 TaxID=2213021 RepID=UPI00103EE27C|nr:dTDP-4-dehydrorhamnose reductase [Meridianimaribacter sp. CL38]TBV28287.1 dTDP-4-dehydrorhamnose reductase [Meridianimaribacter sp. CL38]